MCHSIKIKFEINTKAVKHFLNFMQPFAFEKHLKLTNSIQPHGFHNTKKKVSSLFSRQNGGIKIACRC